MKFDFVDLKPGTVVRAIRRLGMPPGPVVSPGMLGIAVGGGRVNWLIGGVDFVLQDEVEVCS